MNCSDLPAVNAVLNSIAALFLIGGYIAIKVKHNRTAHKTFMLAAVIISALFLTSYLIYHYHVGAVPYPYHDWTRPVYFAILIPHVILAAVMVPFILAALWLALKEKYVTHVKLVRWVWPVWIFVSLSGVAVYLMLYQL
ncbi:MAG: DUF420 domain-containing protein [Candidatus Zixiibacteriota bacterium]